MDGGIFSSLTILFFLLDFFDVVTEDSSSFSENLNIKKQEVKLAFKVDILQMTFSSLYTFKR